MANLPTSWYKNTDLQFDPIGKTLLSVDLEEDNVVLQFDGVKVTLGCEGDCCAHAYFSDLEVGSNLPAKITEWNDGGEVRQDMDDWEVKDTQFIKIKTDKGYIDMNLHTEHNGYYGGWYYVESVA